jgi:hypothetical protein
MAALIERHSRQPMTGETEPRPAPGVTRLAPAVREKNDVWVWPSPDAIGDERVSLCACKGLFGNRRLHGRSRKKASTPALKTLSPTAGI